MTVFINEFHYDNDRGDTGEFIELAGLAGTDLTGWTLELYNGSSGLLYDTIALSGTFTDESSGYGFLSFDQAGIQNGSPDGIALVDDSNNVVEFISYEGSFQADGTAGGVTGAAGLTSTDIGVSEPGDTPIGFSLQLQGTGSEAGDFTWTPAPIDDTPGELNTGQTFVPAGSFDLQITEIWPGNEPGSNLTEDWFEITNTGTVAWTPADGNLFYDDDSQDATAADLINGITELAPGESAVVVVGTDTDAAAFEAVWSPVIDLNGVEVGWTDGSGLSQGGDGVTLFLEEGAQGDATLDSGTILDFEAYPDAAANGGQSYDVDAAAFSVDTGDGDGVATTIAVNDQNQAAVGSPGNGAEIVPQTAVFTLEILHFSDQEAGAAAIQDAPNLSAVLNALEAEDLGNDGEPDNTLILSSGDAFIPGLFYDASDPAFGAAGIADIQIQNELGVQAVALGNHEFDFGTAELAGLISGTEEVEVVNDNGTPNDTSDDFIELVTVPLGDFSSLTTSELAGEDFTGADFPYLSTNLDFSTDENLAPLEVEGGQAPQANTVTSSVVIDVNGEDIGIVGATTPTLDSISSSGGVGISPDSFDSNPTSEQLDALAAEIQLEVDALLAANPEMDKVILLSHMQQFSIELELAERLSGVDVIVAGGSNTRLFDDNDRPRDGDSDQGQYPQFVTNADGGSTAVVNTDGSYEYVGRLVIDFDENGEIIPSSYNENVSGAYATDDQGVADLNAEGLVDPEVQAIVDELEEQIIANESNVFGVSDEYLNGNRSGTFTADDPDGVRTQETNLGNLTADANLAEAQSVDDTVVVSIKNGGGIRADIGQVVVPAGGTEAERLPNEEFVDSDGNVVKPEGGISQNDIQTTLAFNNGLTLMTLTKEELVAVLEHGVSALPGVAGAFPQVSGIKFSFDETQPEGSRIQNAGIFDEDDNLVAELVRDGEIVGDPNEEFRIVTLDFLAAPRFDDQGNYIGGGDGYPFPNTNTDPNAVVDEFGNGIAEVADPDTLARINPVPLEQEGVQTGDATFADDGTEQDALAEYLDDNFNPENGGTAFDEADTGPEGDERIQNLTFREDTVFEDVPETAFDEEVLSSLTLSAGAEIVEFDPDSGLAFVTSSEGLQVVDVTDPANPFEFALLDPAILPGIDNSEITSVAVANGIVAVTVPTADPNNSDDETANGNVVFYDINAGLRPVGSVEVGPLPDSLAFNEDGTKLVVANEGESAGGENEPTVEPNPNGSVSIIDLSAGAENATVETFDFSDSSITTEALLDKGVRTDTSAPSAAADLEPEFVTIEGDTAYITLQENNAVAVIEDIHNFDGFTIDDILPLGTQDFSTVEFDPSNEDDGINLDTYPVEGLRQPDAIATYELNGTTYFLTANEGDGRDVDESRGADLVDGDLSNGEVDTTAFDDETLAALADEAQLGRLKFSNIDGDTDGDGLIEELVTFGARSFSIFDEDGNLVYDSGSDFETITATEVPDAFNSNGAADSFDDRSDDKGPEPEGIVVGEVEGRTYAFVGLERVGGIMVYDITDPENTTFDQYIRNEGDIAPEGLEFVDAADSPTGQPLLMVTSEESGNLTIHEFTPNDPITKIHEVQGSTDFSGDPTAQITVDDVSPLVGEVVTIEAVVTADFQDGAFGTPDSDLNGFFVQEEDADADGDATTSEGIFIFDGSDPDVDVQVGDTVRVTGTVTEFFGETQIEADFIQVVSSGSELPTATTVDFSTTEAILDEEGEFVVDLEALEGMLINIPEEMSVTELFELDATGEYRVSADGRLEQFTQSNEPDQAGFLEHQQDTAARTITLDDGRSGFLNGDTIEVIDGNDGILTSTDEFRMGDTISDITGVVDYSFDEFRLQDATGTYTQVNDRPETPEDVGGDLQVASFNVLNFFTTLDEGSNTTANGQNPRGADNQEEFDRQLEKLIDAIIAIDADILGLVELENNFLEGDDGNAIEFLVDEINAELGEEVYAWVDPGTQFVGTDAISTGIIYKQDEVTLVGSEVVVFEESSADTTFETASALNEFVSPDDQVQDLQRNRPAVIATFEENDSEEVFTVAVNHYKSKGDSNLEDTLLDALDPNEGAGVAPQEDIDALLADPNFDQGDGAGYWNQVREDAAVELIDYIENEYSVSEDEDVLILGDLNAYAQESPVQAFVDAGYVDMADALITDEPSYSFVFDGQQGTLDYALASESFFEKATDATEWHINADEPDAFDYNLDFSRDPGLFDDTTAARNSDHDPIIVGFDFSPAVLGTPGNDRLFGTNAGEVIDGGDGNDRMFGFGGPDTYVVGNDDRDDVRTFDPTEDVIDVSAWGVQEFSELEVFERNGVLTVRSEFDKNDVVRVVGDVSLSGTDLTEDNFIFAPVEDLVITGTPGNDVLEGSAGNDTLDGGLGSDRYFGNGGADTFVLEDGRDTVFDFEDGEDLLDVSAWGVTDFSELEFVDRSQERVFVGDGVNSAIIRSEEPGLDSTDFTADDFIFASV